jgi:quinol monooxygenase YgiN
MNTTEPLILMVKLEPIPEMLREAGQLLRRMIQESYKDPGCESLNLICSESEKNNWYVLERWTSRELWELHASTERNLADGKKLDQLLLTPVTIAFYLEQ